MKVPIPHLIILYASLVQSLKVVTKRGSGKKIVFHFVRMYGNEIAYIVYINIISVCMCILKMSGQISGFL